MIIIHDVLYTSMVLFFVRLHTMVKNHEKKSKTMQKEKTTKMKSTRVETVSLDG
jgi:hypothetical protein